VPHHYKLESKKAEASTLGDVVWIIIIILAIIIFLVLLSQFSVGEGFFYSACQGEMEGTKLYDPGTGVLIGTLNARCAIFDNTGVKTCESAYPSVYFEEFGDIPFCIWLTDIQVRRGEEEESLGTFTMPSRLEAIDCSANPDDSSCLNYLDINQNGFPDQCVVNGLVSCSTLSQQDPKCQEVPRCEPVNIIEMLIRGLKR
jgi:hypothetical protein